MFSSTNGQRPCAAAPGLGNYLHLSTNDQSQEQRVWLYRSKPHLQQETMDYHTIATPQSHQTDMGSNSNEEAHHALTIWEVNKDRLSSMHQKVSGQTNHSKPCCRMELVLHFQNSSKPDQNQRKILSSPSAPTTMAGLASKWSSSKNGDT